MREIGLLRIVAFEERPVEGKAFSAGVDVPRRSRIGGAARHGRPAAGVRSCLRPVRLGTPGPGDTAELAER